MAADYKITTQQPRRNVELDTRVTAIIRQLYQSLYGPGQALKVPGG